jgi:hypothetical protein
MKNPCSKSYSVSDQKAPAGGSSSLLPFRLPLERIGVAQCYGRVTTHCCDKGSKRPVDYVIREITDSRVEDSLSLINPSGEEQCSAIFMPVV